MHRAGKQSSLVAGDCVRGKRCVVSHIIFFATRCNRGSGLKNGGIGPCQGPTFTGVTPVRNIIMPRQRFDDLSIFFASYRPCSEPFPSWLCLANLQYVDGLGELVGAPGAAAELTEDSPGLELGIRALAG
jgi:hypothetical protein